MFTTRYFSQLTGSERKNCKI